jgi:hypothetical protein
VPAPSTEDGRALATPREEQRPFAENRLRFFVFSGPQLDEARMGLDQSSRPGGASRFTFSRMRPESYIRYGYRDHSRDRLHDTTGLWNEALSQLIENAEIDLPVDLNGYSTMRRLPLFTMRPAPVVVGWFNMYATTGISSYDYLIGDDVAIPPEEEKLYCEKIVRVPGSYLTFEVTYPMPAVTDPPCLAKTTITLGCLASPYKITDEVIGAWSRILDQVPNSSLIRKNGALASPGTRQFVHGLFERQHVWRKSSPGRPVGSLAVPRNLRRNRYRTGHLPL